MGKHKASSTSGPAKLLKDFKRRKAKVGALLDIVKGCTYRPYFLTARCGLARIAQVGKKAIKQANVTKINLKTRQIYVPTQNILAPGGGGKGQGVAASSSSTKEYTTTKGHNLSSLLSQLRHYSPATRAAALQGLRELLGRHHDLASRELGTILESTSDALVDSDDEVRLALLAFFRSVLPSLERSALAPFLNLLCTVACMGLTSLDSNIRRDALTFLDTITTNASSTMIAPHLPSIVANFPPLLDKPPQPTTRPSRQSQQAQPPPGLGLVAGQACRPEVLVVAGKGLDHRPGHQRGWGSGGCFPDLGLEGHGRLHLKAESTTMGLPVVVSPCDLPDLLLGVWGRCVKMSLAAGSTCPSSHHMGRSLVPLVPKLREYVLEMAAQSDAVEGNNLRLVTPSAMEALQAITDLTHALLHLPPSQLQENESLLLFQLEPLVTVLLGSFPVQLAEGVAAHTATPVEEERMTTTLANLGIIEVAVQWMLLSAGAAPASLPHTALTSYVTSLFQEPPFSLGPDQQPLESPRAHEVLTRAMRLLRLLLPALAEGRMEGHEEAMKSWEGVLL